MMKSARFLTSPNVQVTFPPSFANRGDDDRNWMLCRELLFDETHRMPWRDDAELAQFRTELADAVGAG